MASDPVNDAVRQAKADEHRAALMCAIHLGTQSDWRKLRPYLVQGIDLPGAAGLFVHKRATELWAPDHVARFQEFLRRYMDAGYFQATDKLAVPDMTHAFLVKPYSLLVRAMAASNVPAVEVLLERGSYEEPGLREELVDMQKVNWNLIPPRTPQTLEQSFEACVDYLWVSAASVVMPRFTAAIMKGRMSAPRRTGVRSTASSPSQPPARQNTRAL